MDQFKAFTDANRFNLEKKNVDVVRMKGELPIKPKVEVPPAKSNEKLVSILKTETIAVLKPDECLDGFFGSSEAKNEANGSIQLNVDDLNRISENAVR